MNKLGADLIQAGTPVPCDCYDGQGHLVLKSGLTVESQKQVEYLLECGLFSVRVPGQECEERLEVERAASPFQLLGEYYNRLEQILMHSRQIAHGADDDRSILREQTAPFSAQILQLAMDIQSVCQTDADATLGSIQLHSSGSRYSISHALSRAVVCELLATRRGIPQKNRRQLIAAALTCDLSMLQLQDDLTCQEGPLRTEQQKAIADHPHETAKLLAAMGTVDPGWINAVIQHHEFPNGKGYPAGLEGDVISPWARILKLADTYTAMISPRAYRKALLSKSVLRQLFLRRGGEFDEDLAVFFVKELGVFPPGLFVRLQSGELAIVIRRRANPRAPLVKAIVGPRGAALDPPIARETDNREYEIVDVLERDASVSIDQPSLWGYHRE